MALADNVKAQVLQQVEFYFSDSNVHRDRFLLGKIKENAEGYVDLALICSFSRMAKLLKLPPKPPSVPPKLLAQVADALAGSGEVALSECRTKVRRQRPLADAGSAVREADARTVYSAPLPFDATLDALSAFFRTAGPINAVRMRRHLTSKDFRGSVFIEFQSKEVAEQVVRDAKLVYEGAGQRLEMKLDYMKRKSEEGQKKAAETGGGEGKRSAEEAELDAGGTSPPELKRQAPEPAQPAPLQYTEGLVFELRFPAEAAAELHYGAIKEALGGGAAGVRFVQHSKGGDIAVVRLADGDKAAALQAKRGEDGCVPLALQADGPPARVQLRQLEGDEERAFHQAAADYRAENAGVRGGRGGGQRGGTGRGGRGPAGRRGGGRGGGRGGRRGGLGGRVI